MEEGDYTFEDVLSIIEQEKETTEWVLDFACSNHLCSHVTNTRFKLERRFIYKTYKNGLTRTLIGVRHVLSLRRTVISVGVLDSKGCSFVAKNGIKKVKKGSQIMLMLRKVGNLYFLLENTYVGGEVVKIAKEWKW